MLRKLFKQFKYGQKGFTLIELLVVVAILGVLAAVAIPNVSRFVSSGTLAAANSELASVQLAVAAYMSENDNTMDDAADLTGGGTCLSEYLDKPIKGIYTFAANGTLTEASYDPNLTYSTTSGQFEAP